MHHTCLPVRVIRSTRLFAHVIQGLLTTALVLPPLPRAQREVIIKAWSVKLMKILNVKVTVSGNGLDHGKRGVMFVGNHVSWLDIWAIKQIYPVQFAAKSEVRSWPFIGWMAAKTGTIFIERDRKQTTSYVVEKLESAIALGENICFFPEGTTTDGSHMLPFKPSLLQAAINQQAPIIPFAIRYPMPDGSPNLQAAFYGEMTLIESLGRILSTHETKAELHFLPIMENNTERRAVALHTRHMIASWLNLQLHREPKMSDDLQDTALLTHGPTSSPYQAPSHLQ